MKPHVLLVDGNFVAFKSYFMNKNNPEIMERFFNFVLKTAMDHNCIGLCICWDSHINFRKRVDPTYKDNRSFDKKTEEQKQDVVKILENINHIKSIASASNINQCEYLGYEGDDVIYTIVKEKPEPNYIILANDKDMYAYLTPKVSMFTGEKYMTYRMFVNEYQIEPSEWDKVKMIAGCYSDNIKGLQGIGEKTAVKFLRKELSPDKKAYKYIVDNKELIKKNGVLVRAALIPNFKCKLKTKIDIDKLEEQFILHNLNISARNWSILNANNC